MILKEKKFTIILILAILAILIFVGYKWYEEKMKLVDSGLADSKFPYHEYTILELARNGSVTDYVPELEEAWKALPTRTTPRETLDMYIQALRDGDIEQALNYIEKEDYMEYDPDNPWRRVHYRISEQDRKYLNNIKDGGKLEWMVRRLEEIRTEIASELKKLEKDSTGEKAIRYQYKCTNGEGGICYKGFTKDLWGDWKLVSPRL